MAYIDKPIRVEFYDNRYDFTLPIREHLNVYSLSRIHELVEDQTLVTRKTDQSNPFQKKFYSIGNGFYSVYHDFIKWFVEPMIGDGAVFQKIPTFRIQMPNNKGVGAKHKDSDYSHSPDEQNFWLPVTKAYDTNTMWVEGEPKELEYGQVLHFDGANKIHGNKPNTTPDTRVSLDFRIIPLSSYKPDERTSINTKLPMKVGGYWDQL